MEINQMIKAIRNELELRKSGKTGKMANQTVEQLNQLLKEINVVLILSTFKQSIKVVR